MAIQRDDWTPLLQSMKDKVSAQGRRKLLFQMIGDIYDITILNFGEMGNGPMRPWNEEILKSENYKRTIGGRQFATLVRTEEEREKCKGTRWEGGTGTHLVNSFVTVIAGDSASLTNTSPYATAAQFGEGQPYRPYFPTTKDGLNLTPYAESRQLEIIEGYFQD